MGEAADVVAGAGDAGDDVAAEPAGLGDAGVLPRRGERVVDWRDAADAADAAAWAMLDAIPDYYGDVGRMEAPYDVHAAAIGGLCSQWPMCGEIHFQKECFT